jgi:hypothetical protein
MEIDSVGPVNNLPIHGICHNYLIVWLVDVAVAMTPGINDVCQYDDKGGEPHDDWIRLFFSTYFSFSFLFSLLLYSLLFMFHLLFSSKCVPCY